MVENGWKILDVCLMFNFERLDWKFFFFEIIKQDKLYSSTRVNTSFVWKVLVYVERIHENEHNALLPECINSIIRFIGFPSHVCFQADFNELTFPWKINNKYIAFVSISLNASLFNSFPLFVLILPSIKRITTK